MTIVRRDVFGVGGVIDLGGVELPYPTPEEGARLLGQLVDEGTLDLREAVELLPIIRGLNQADQAMGRLLRWSARGPRWRQHLTAIAGRVVMALTPEPERTTVRR